MSAPPNPVRHVAVAVPARNEEEHLPACLAALDRAAERYRGPVTLFVLANHCDDATIPILRRTRLHHARLRWAAVSLLPGARHAGWARRLALDGAAACLGHPTDVLATTDADTLVEPRWIERTAVHVDRGAEALAGRVLTRRAERVALGAAAMGRLNLLERYCTAIEWLRADREVVGDDPWPRHYYEGGASLALTLNLYRRIGGAPTPSVGEDRALFAAAVAARARVRHPLDVRVFTSIRTEGRAPGGVADVFAHWLAQPDDLPLHETYAVPAMLEPELAREEDKLSFQTLPDALATARALIRARQSEAAVLQQQRMGRIDHPPHRAWEDEAVRRSGDAPAELGAVTAESPTLQAAPPAHG